MSAKRVSQLQRTLQVDSTADNQVAQVGSLKRFGAGFKRRLVALPIDHGQATPIDGNAGADLAVVKHVCGANGQTYARTIGFDASRLAHGFN